MDAVCHFVNLCEKSAYRHRDPRQTSVILPEVIACYLLCHNSAALNADKKRTERTCIYVGNLVWGFLGEKIKGGDLWTADHGRQI